MTSLNNIFLVFLFLNLFQLINCCLNKNVKGCDNTKNTPKSCCAGLYCSPKTNSCSCIEEKNPCGGLHNPYKCCPGLKCLDGGCYKNSEKGCSDNGRGCEKNDNCCSKNCIAGFCKCSGKDGACEVTIDCCDGLKCSNGKCNKI